MVNILARSGTPTATSVIEFRGPTASVGRGSAEIDERGVPAVKVDIMTNKFSLLASVLTLLVLGALSETSGSIPDSEANGVFINEDRATIQVEVISEDKKDKTIMILPPEAIERTLFARGQVRLYTPSDNNVSGRLLFTRSLPTPMTAPKFLEQETRTFYFRVVGRKIILVKPTDLTSKERKWLKERTKYGW